MPRGNPLNFATIGLLFLFLALIPLWNDTFYTSLCARATIFAIAAVGLNLALSFGGMVSLGHAAFLGIGAYTVGILSYHGQGSGWIHLLVALIGSIFYALVTGVIVLRGGGARFIIMTMSVAQIVFFFVVSLESYGGSDGIIIEMHSDFGSFFSLENRIALYYVALTILLLSLVLVKRLVDSPFGLIIRGARENERRMRVLGYNTYPFRLAAYAISGMICAVAGVFLANLNDFISPDMMHWTRSADLLLMVVLGGVGSLIGPIAGTFFFLLIEHFLSLAWTHWKFLFGTMLALSVLIPRGAGGCFFLRWWRLP